MAAQAARRMVRADVELLGTHTDESSGNEVRTYEAVICRANEAKSVIVVAERNPGALEGVYAIRLPHQSGEELNEIESAALDAVSAELYDSPDEIVALRSADDFAMASMGIVPGRTGLWTRIMFALRILRGKPGAAQRA